MAITSWTLRLLVAVFAAASVSTASNVPVKVAPAKPAHPNVILITIDTLRADHVGCYGAQNVKTPTIDVLASDGIIFERAISQVPLTWPSHAVILTGTYPFQNGVQDFTGQPLDPRFRSIAQALKQAGYATGAVVSAFVLDRSWGLARGFDYYDDAFSAETFQKKDIGLVDRRAAESVDHAIAWLKKTPRRPFFLWLHLYDPHSPYDPPEPFRTEYRGHLYDGEIAYADRELGRLMAWLKQNRLYDSSAITLLSDHGESLGEHGEDEHGFFVYNATVHVPLIVKPPASSGIRPERRASPVETAAVAPSLLQLAGVKDVISRQFQSQGLVNTDKVAAYSETLYPFSSFGWSPLHALETDRFHYIEAPKPELYDLQSDPRETSNLASQQPATVTVLKQQLENRLRSNPLQEFPAKGNAVSSGNLSPDAQEKLRALGYFGFRAALPAKAQTGDLPDPKDKLAEFNAILKAQDAFERGDTERAESLLGPVEKSDPEMYIIPFLLGESALRRQDWGRAADQLQRSLELNPSFDNAMTGLARALVKLGRMDDARNWLEKALQSNPQNYRAWYQIGLMSSADTKKAQQSFTRTVEIQPNFSAGQRELGMILFQQGNYAGAALHLEKAIQLGLDDAHLRNFLGICYSRTGRISEALKSYNAALKLDPNLAEAHLNLAYALTRKGNAASAQSEYEAACRLDQRYCSLVPAANHE